MIPRRIFSIWLSDKPGPGPDLVEQCLQTHRLPGYQWRRINLANCDKSSDYVRDCLERKLWVKAADYLRVLYLYREGGIYLDADMRVLKPFDDLLAYRAFAGREDNGFVANSVIGAQAGHPALLRYLQHVDLHCTADDGKVFEDGMEVWTNIAYSDPSIAILPPEVFFPYNHQTGKTLQTEATLTFHHFMKSWVTT
jgi:mannosyltransferase OCH1-like enzyme